MYKIFVKDKKENDLLNEIYSLFLPIFEGEYNINYLAENFLKKKLKPKSEKVTLIQAIINSKLNNVLETLKNEYNYSLRSLKLNENNKPQESIKIVDIKIDDMSNETNWEQSKLCNWINSDKKILFFFIKESNEIKDLLYFFDMFVLDFDENAKKNAKYIFLDTKEKFNNKGVLNDKKTSNNKKYSFIGMGDKLTFHVRTSAENSSSKNSLYTTQTGEVIVKHAFWINANYVNEKYQEFILNNNKLQTKNNDFINKNIVEENITNFYYYNFGKKNEVVVKKNGEYFNVPEIPNFIKNNIRNKNNNFCFLADIDVSDMSFKCPFGKNVNKTILEENQLNYTHLHHLIPKYYFYEKYENGEIDYLDWNEIHSEINLIPLCNVCHSAIHKGKNEKELVAKVINSIISKYKSTGKYKDFEKFVDRNLYDVDIENIIDIYTK